MCNTARTTVTADRTAPSLLRKWAADVVTNDYLNADELLGDVQLVISELVTNAAQAASPQITVTLTSCRDLIHVAVTDTAPGTPTIQPPTTTDTSGRGLLIIAAIAADWGTNWADHADPSAAPNGIASTAPGKTVWAKLTVTGTTAPIFAAATYDQHHPSSSGH